MITIDGIDMDDGVDEPDEDLLAEDNDDWLGEEGCLFPAQCLMPGIHYTSECHTAEDMESWSSQDKRARAWDRRNKRALRKLAAAGTGCRADQLMDSERAAIGLAAAAVIAAGHAPPCANSGRPSVGAGLS